MSSIENPIIRLDKVRKIYKTGDENTLALNIDELEINKGEFVAIMGPSGSGKSTLMHIIGLLDTPTSGQYSFNGRDISRIGKNEQSDIRNQKIGFVFQHFNLLPRTTVLENVLLPSNYGTIAHATKRAKEVIAAVGLEDRINHKSNELSGGQIQRVAIARALMMSPAIILADEPTGNLDSKKSEEIMDIFTRINHEGNTILVITHESNVAKYAKRIITLKDGAVVSDRSNK